jgi:hypothetical protein
MLNSEHHVYPLTEAVPVGSEAERYRQHMVRTMVTGSCYLRPDGQPNIAAQRVETVELPAAAVEPAAPALAAVQAETLPQ